MNLSLRGRVTTSFVIANILVLVLTFLVFYFLNVLNQDIESIIDRSNRVASLTDEIRISAVSILKYQKQILRAKKPPTEALISLTSVCESFTSQLHTLDSLYADPEIKKIIAQMLSYVDSLKLILHSAPRARAAGDLADKIIDSFSQFQEFQRAENSDREREIKSIIGEIKREMMIVLIIGFLFTIILALVVPGKIALPFRKIRDAIRELRDCNFDVSIYYSQDDEIGEIAREMNKMIHAFKVFDELRTDRISVEKRKFDALANLVKRYVLVANAKGKLMYMNNHLYSLLQVQSENIIGKDMDDMAVPKAISESYNLAIKRRSKIENVEIAIHSRKPKESEGDNAKGQESDSGSSGEKIFEGYATIIPIRGKESSQDYYLMVLSKELFA